MAYGRTLDLIEQSRVARTVRRLPEVASRNRSLAGKARIKARRKRNRQAVAGDWSELSKG